MGAFCIIIKRAEVVPRASSMSRGEDASPSTIDHRKINISTMNKESKVKLMSMMDVKMRQTLAELKLVIVDEELEQEAIQASDASEEVTI